METTPPSKLAGRKEGRKGGEQARKTRKGRRGGRPRLRTFAHLHLFLGPNSEKNKLDSYCASNPLHPCLQYGYSPEPILDLFRGFWAERRKIKSFLSFPSFWQGNPIHTQTPHDPHSEMWRVPPGGHPSHIPLITLAP